MTTPDVVSAPVDEQRQAFVDLARDFAQREIAPHAAGWDRRKEYPGEVIA